VGLFAKYLLGETHTRRSGGKDKAIAADTVSTKIHMVAFEFVWGLNCIQPTDASYDAWVKWLNELVKNFKDRYNKENESPTADAVSTLQTLPLFGVIEPNNPSQMLETNPDRNNQFSITAPPLDLRTVIDGLMVSRNSIDYTKILMLILTRSAVGRPGENTYLSYKFMAMEPFSRIDGPLVHAKTDDNRPCRLRDGLQVFPNVSILWIRFLLDHGRPVPKSQNCRYARSKLRLPHAARNALPG
jgi:hypothetical protein